MAISSPLDITWDHAYWVEGPEFIALYPQTQPTSGGWKLGPLSLDPGSDPTEFRVPTWPDEVGTADATQASADKRPMWKPSLAAFNSHPAIEFEQQIRNEQLISANYASAFTQPGEVVVIGRDYDDAADDGGSFVNVDEWMIWRVPPAGTTWQLYAGSGGVIGGTFNSDVHVFDGILDTTASDLRIDGTSVDTGNAGSSTLAKTTIGHPASISNFGTKGIVFVGIKDSALSATDRTDLRTWSQSYYSTP